jgi:hypothetical protein
MWAIHQVNEKLKKLVIAQLHIVPVLVQPVPLQGV